MRARVMREIDHYLEGDYNAKNLARLSEDAGPATTRFTCVGVLLGPTSLSRERRTPRRSELSRSGTHLGTGPARFFAL